MQNIIYNRKYHLIGYYVKYRVVCDEYERVVDKKSVHARYKHIRNKDTMFWYIRLGCPQSSKYINAYIQYLLNNIIKI